MVSHLSLFFYGCLKAVFSFKPNSMGYRMPKKIWTFWRHSQEIGKKTHSNWANYSDLSRGHPKDGGEKLGNPFQNPSKNSGLGIITHSIHAVKYTNCLDSTPSQIPSKTPQNPPNLPRFKRLFFQETSAQLPYLRYLLGKSDLGLGSRC